MKIKLVITLLMLFTLLSCNRKVDQVRTVSLQHYFTGSLSSGMDELSSVVNSENKNINLVATPLDHEEFKVSIRVQLDSPNPPDLFTYWAGARTKYLVDNGKVSPITEAFNKMIDRAVFEESVLNACSYKGEIYLLPITRHYVGFFYNKGIFSDLGITPPENWEDLKNAAELMKSKSITPFALGARNRWPAQFWFDFILLRTAGFKYRERLMESRASYNDPEVINTLKMWKELIDNDYFGSSVLEDDWDKAALYVSKKEAAMTLMGTWTIPLLEQEGLRADQEYGFFPFPEIYSVNEKVSLGPIDGILSSMGSKNKEASKKVISQLSKPETQELLNSVSGAIAPQVNVNNDIYNSVQLQIKDLISKSTHWAFNYDLASPPVVSEAGLNFFIDFLENPGDYEKLLNELEDYVGEL